MTTLPHYLNSPTSCNKEARVNDRYRNLYETNTIRLFIMTVAILATGDELINGDSLNTNSYYLAQAINSEGLILGRHLICSDLENDIYDCLEFLAQNHSIIIITGGLGPTSDDRTRYALARFLQAPLVEFPAAIAHITKRLAFNMALNACNQKQALFPAKAVLLPNPNGTAMGCYYWYNEQLFILLPGPPRECLFMFDTYVLSLLQQVQHSDQQLLKWRLFGVAESQIAQQLDEALSDVDCETGYRLETPYVECKVRFKPHLISTIKQIVEPIVTPHIITNTDKKASEQLCDSINHWQESITIIDNVTGGLLQTLIQKPSNHHFLHFSKTHQDTFLFDLYGLEGYWLEQQPYIDTTLTINYQHVNGCGTETHRIPYRSALVVYYAAEWLSFRLFHLINQLHQ
jgi:nicotinamide-nucleotide amidase